MSEYNYKEFKVYGSKDWNKVINFKLLEHFRKEEDSQVEKSMGWKIAVETTNDGWKKDWDKKIIMLEWQELVEIIALLQNHLTSMKAMRNNPVKYFELKNQWNDYFVSLKSNNTVHGFKMNKYDWLRLLWFASKALEKEFDKDYWIFIEWYKYVNTLYQNYNESANVEQIKEKVEVKTTNKDKEIEIEEVSNENIERCADCWIEMDKVKFEKVIKYSKDKHWKCLCMSCQKKQ